MGRTSRKDSAVKHHVHLELHNILPIHSVPYRARPEVCVIGGLEIDHMLAMNVIKAAQTEWASPVVFAPKHNENLRLRVDYRKLNTVTVCDLYPLQHMDKKKDVLGDAQVFSTFGANCGYWHIEVKEFDKDNIE